MTYSKNLSFIHDQGFGEVAMNAADVITSTIKKRGKGSLVVDLGCGQGP